MKLGTTSFSSTNQGPLENHSIRAVPATGKVGLGNVLHRQGTGAFQQQLGDQEFQQGIQFLTSIVSLYQNFLYMYTQTR